MTIVNPAFGSNAISPRMVCGCVCTQDVTNPTPKFDVQRDAANSDSCAATCSTREFNHEINMSDATAMHHG